MSEKELNVRFQLRYDTFQNWVDADPILKEGEIAVCTVPTGSGAVEQTTPPAILFKVGDGKLKFSALPWASGLAADVYEWAKQSTKPIYDYKEITNVLTTPTNSGLQISDGTESPVLEFDSNAVFVLDGGSAPVSASVEGGNN